MVILLNELVSFAGVDLLLGSLVGELCVGFALVFVFLALLLQLLLLVLEDAAFVFFSADVALDAEHQKDLLAELVVQFHVFCSSGDLVWNIHALEHLGQSLIDLSRQHQWLA